MTILYNFGNTPPIDISVFYHDSIHPKLYANKEVILVWNMWMCASDYFHAWSSQLLQQLHSENLLGYRFPIGLEEQIKKWDVNMIKAFHERWYFPANATLYIVGDIDSVDKAIEQIEVCL